MSNGTAGSDPYARHCPTCNASLGLRPTGEVDGYADSCNLAVRYCGAGCLENSRTHGLQPLLALPRPVR